MAEMGLSSPFGQEHVDDVPLTSSPLARVLAQVRFPRLSALVSGDEVAHGVAAAMRADYPILHDEREVAVTITPEGVTQAPGSARIWHLRNADDNWQVSFGDTFLAIDTSAYSSRNNFSVRLETAWRCFADVVQPPFTERVGVRYINRMTDPERIHELSALVRPEVLGGLAVPLHGVWLDHSISEALYHLGDLDGLQARWGLLPSGAVLDPTLPPVSERSWVLDIDSFRVGRGSIDPPDVAAQGRELGERAYRYFRWVVTPEFLKRFGGGVV